MYLKNIPQSVIDWCNQNDFPLFAMPWEISCTQLVQEFCTIIMKRAQKEREYGDIFQSIIKKQADKIDPVRSKFGRIEKEEVSLSDKMTYVEEYSLHHGHFSFRSLLEAQSGKMEVVVTFLAILELMKMGKIVVSQEYTFDDIKIESKIAA